MYDIKREFRTRISIFIIIIIRQGFPVFPDAVSAVADGKTSAQSVDRTALHSITNLYLNIPKKKKNQQTH